MFKWSDPIRGGFCLLLFLLLPFKIFYSFSFRLCWTRIFIRAEGKRPFSCNLSIWGGDSVSKGISRAWWHSRFSAKAKGGPGHTSKFWRCLWLNQVFPLNFTTAVPRRSLRLQGPLCFFLQFRQKCWPAAGARIFSWPNSKPKYLLCLFMYVWNTFAFAKCMCAYLYDCVEWGECRWDYNYLRIYLYVPTQLIKAKLFHTTPAHGKYTWRKGCSGHLQDERK